MAPTIHENVPWRDVFVFAVIAYALTWGWDAIFVLPKLGGLLSGTTPADPTAVFGNMLFHLPAMFGPLLAAVTMRHWISREGLRGSLGLRQSWQAYAVAVVAPILFLAVVAGVALVSGLARQTVPEQPWTLAILPLLVILLLLESVLALGEEYGWRGYLLPRLMPLGEVRATLLLGVIWSLWHFPVLLAGVILGGNNLGLVVIVHLCLITLAAFPYTWLARTTGYSPVVAAIFHGANNWGQQRLLTVLIFGNLLAAIAMISVGWLIVVAVYYGFRLLSRRIAG